MNPYSIPPLITSLLALFLGFLTLISKNPRVRLTFPLVAFSVFTWLFGYFVVYSTSEYFRALFWVRLLYLGVIFIPGTSYHFTVAFLKIENQKRTILLAYLVSFIFVILSRTKYFIVGLYRYFWGFQTKVGHIHNFFLIFFFVIMARVILFLYTYYLEAKKKHLFQECNRIKYILISYFISTFAAFDFLPNYGVGLYPMGFICIGIHAMMSTYAIIAFRALDIKVAITRAGIFLFVYAFVLGLPFWFGFNTGLWVWSLVLMGILATAGPFIYRRLQRKAEDVLLTKQKHYQKLLLQAATGMVREHNLGRLLKLIVHVVKRAVRIEFAAVFLEDKENNWYNLKTIRDCGVLPKDLTFPYEHPAIKLVQQKRIPLSYEEIGPLFKGSFTKPIHLIVPCFIDDSLLGFLALGEKKDRTFYTQDDINVFEILSRQTALAVEYCIFLEEFRKGQEKIFTAEKLASIGGMASGVAHQIRNRLDVFGSHADKQRFKIEDFIKDHPQLLAQNPELKKVLDYLVEEADGIESNVQRCGQLITGVLKFAGTQQMEAGFSEFSLKEVIDLCIPPLKAKHSISVELPLDLEIELGNDDIIYASKGQMVEVMFNSIDNGYEAIEEKKLYLSDEEKKKYKPFIKIELYKPGDSYIIKISDNGIGIKQENKLKIFSPYFTTKSSTISGTGIGMYVIKRIIEENHKGKIRFESTFRKGTTFFIELPKTNRMKR